MAGPSHRVERRGTRVDDAFWVEIVGIDEGKRLAYGNVSVSGIYFRRDGDLGERRWPWRWAAATIEQLRIATQRSPDEVCTVLGCLVRRNTVEDIWSDKPSTGMAYQFLPESDAQIDQIAGLVRAAGRNLVETGAVLESLPLRATIHGESPRPRVASLYRVSAGRIVLEASRPLEEGKFVRMDVRSPGDAPDISVHCRVIAPQERHPEPGRVLSTLELDTRDVSFDELCTRLSAFIQDVVVPDEAGPLRAIPHFQGSLERVSLPSVLTVAAHLRSCGTLKLKGNNGRAWLRLHDGHLVDGRDSRSEAGSSPHALVTRLRGWRETVFEYVDGDGDGAGPYRVPLLELAAGLEPQAQPRRAT